MRILVVGYSGSAHLVHRLELLSGLGWDIHVFPCNSDAPSTELRDVTVYVPPGSRPGNFDPSVRAVALPGTRYLTDHERVDLLAQLIGELRPDLLHSEQFFSSSYLSYDARALRPAEFPPWIASNWGHCISYFGRDLGHTERIKAVLRTCDYYTCECYRDVALARAFGFRGRALPVVPIAGHFDLPEIASLRAPELPSARRTITIKGYQHSYGRAYVALDALAACRDILDGYRLDLFAGMAHVVDRATRLCDELGIDLRVVSGIDRQVRHEEILRMHGRSRASVSLGTGDGICTSFLEAMAMGSFPVQSDTGCSREWTRDGRGALFVGPDDTLAVADALRRALTDDVLVDSAAEINGRIVAEHLDREVVRARFVDLYRSVVADAAIGASRAS